MGLALDWTALLLRWFHVVAGIAWIGSSFFFIWLDRTIAATGQRVGRIEGELWMIHGGGFYRMEKRLIAPGESPATLHWVKWEATLTWISGLFLLGVVYYLTGGAYLLDPSVSSLSEWQAVALSVGVLFGGVAVYEAIWRSPLARAGWPAIVVSLAALGGLIYLLFSTLSGRAAFVHVGALLGTMMVANVWEVILPAQRRMVAAAARGEEPDYTEGAKAKVRSVHNSYLTFPVIFTMISSHFPQTYAGDRGWVVLICLTVAGAAARHAMIGGRAFGLAKEWALVPTAAGIAAAIIIATPGAAAPLAATGAQAGEAVSFADVRVVIAARCASCHSSAPTDALFRAPPNGIAFDSPQQIQALTARILERAVVQRTMPFANQSGMTDAERDLLRRWIESGAPLR